MAHIIKPKDTIAAQLPRFRVVYVRLSEGKCKFDFIETHAHDTIEAINHLLDYAMKEEQQVVRIDDVLVAR